MTAETIEHPQAHATYPRDHTAIVGSIFGPSALGEYWRAVDAVYDPEADRTRVGFRIVPMTELVDEIEHATKAARR